MGRDQRKILKRRAAGEWVLCLFKAGAIFCWGTEAECRAHLAEIAESLPAGLVPELMPPL